MENKVLLWENSNGTINITIPISKKTAIETEDQYIERIKASARIGSSVFLGVFDKSIVPTDRKNRNAWVFRNGIIEIDSIKKAENDIIEEIILKFNSIDVKNIKDISDVKKTISEIVDFLKKGK